MRFTWNDEGRPRLPDRGLREAVPAEARREAEREAGSRFWRRFLTGAAPEPVPSHLGTVEDPEPGKVGICCSGGGIRSAAFCLGALQALQEEGELRRAAYLAAVSGGSYIAGAISTVAFTGADARPGSGPDPSPRQSGNSDPRLLGRKAPFEPGSPEEQYLRNRCSYLAPTLADKVYLGWRMLLGLLFNLTFIAAPVIGSMLIAAGLFYVPLLPHLAGDCRAEGCEAVIPAWFWIAPVTAFGVASGLGLATLLVRWDRDARRRTATVWTVRFLVLAALLGLVLVGLPYLVELLEGGGKATTVEPAGTPTGRGFGAGVIAVIVAIGAQLTHLFSNKEVQDEAGRARKAFTKLSSGARLALAYLAAALAGPVLLVAVMTVTLAVGLAEASSPGHVDLGLTLVGAAVLAAFAFVYAVADLNNWSLHPFYKRRLASVFSLKRIAVSDLTEDERRKVEAVPPSDPATDVGIAVERDFDKPLPLSETALDAAYAHEWPTLLVCAAANVSDTGASPPGRPVTSFTFSAHTVGGPLVGAVPTWRFEGAFESRDERFPPPSAAGRRRRGPRTVFQWAARRARARRHRDLTLLAAIAMSGAAISPSMGKLTRRSLTFLLTLANIRLGVWLPNPRWLGEWEVNERLRNRNLRPRPSYLLRELFGVNRVGGKYIYVSDGGHYENLGLVELLRRGCTEVYCIDASGVGKGRAEFEALGDAIALARSELGVEVEFDGDPADLAPNGEAQLAKADLASGRISYPDGTAGTLVYVRNSITPKAPWDAQAYHKADPRFPHNPTIDQLYTDQKFEAYRVLGQRAGAEAAEAMLSA